MISTNLHKNPPNFTESSDFFDFIVLGRQNQGSLQTRHAFKAQMVTHFVISMHFRGNPGMYSKNIYSLDFICWGGIYDFLMENCTFPVSGFQNTSQILTFIKGIAPGAKKMHLEAKSALFGIEAAKNCKFTKFNESGMLIHTSGPCSQKVSINDWLRKGFGEL